MPEALVLIVMQRMGQRPTGARVGKAVADPDGVWLDPDPASSSGLSVRVIGYSLSAHAVLSVVLVPAGADPGDRPHGERLGG